jgi:hypothetical protein
MSFFSIDNINPAAAVTINSSASTIGIGNDAVAQSINIGTGAAARTITVGNTSGATALDVNLGTGGLTVDCTDGGTISLDANGAPSNFTLTSTATADDLTIALAGATDSSLILSSTGTGVDALQVTASVGGMDITAANTMDITTSANNGNITIDPHGSGTLALGSADNTAVNIGALAITATSVNALTLTDGTASFTLAGTGATSISAATTLDLDCTGNFTINSSGGTINIGDDEDAQAISIGTGAAARTITIGNATTTTAVNITSGASGDITLDAGGADVILKDGGSQYGALTNSSTNLIIKSGSTTALTFSGANITTGGTLELGSTSAIADSAYSGDAILVSDSGVIKHMIPSELALAISAVSTTTVNTYTAKQSIDLAAADLTPAVDGSHFHIEGGLTMTDTNTSGSGTAAAYNQVSIEAVTLAATNSSVTTTEASTFYINAAPTAGTNETITNAYALFVDAGAARFDGFLINTYDTVTFGSNSGDITATSANGTAHNPTSSTVFLQAVASSTDTTYHWDLGAFSGGGNGSILHLFFDKSADTGITGLQVNFGNDKLIAGSGLNDYISFTTTGQSASLVYINSLWRIINTGGAVGVI